MLLVKGTHFYSFPGLRTSMFIRTQFTLLYFDDVGLELFLIYICLFFKIYKKNSILLFQNKLNQIRI